MLTCQDMTPVMNQQRGLFDERDRLALISKEGDPLETLNQAIDWELFRGKLRRCFAKERKGPGGRPPFDYVMMFKVLVLQRLYNLGALKKLPLSSRSLTDPAPSVSSPSHST